MARVDHTQDGGSISPTKLDTMAPDVLRVREAWNRKFLKGRKQALGMALRPAAATVAVLITLTSTNHGFLTGVNYHQQKLTRKAMSHRWKRDVY